MDDSVGRDLERSTHNQYFDKYSPLEQAVLGAVLFCF